MNKYYTSYIILSLLLVPNEFFTITSLYVFDSPAEIKYEWLVSHFSAFFLPFFIVFIFTKKSSITKSLLKLILIIFLIDVLKLMYYKSSFIISNFNFELYYGYFFGLSLFGIIDSKEINIKHVFYDVLMKFNILSIFLFSLIFNPFRANIINLDYNSSGFFILFFSIYNFINGKNFVGWISLTALFLTGSRINISFGALFVFYLFLKSFVKLNKTFSKKMFVLNTFLGIIIPFFILLIFYNTDSSRILYFISNLGSVTQDSSFVGRVLSIVVGFEAIKMYPFGIFFSFIDQQMVMQTLGYPTFPHSYFLSFYLVSGLVSIYFLFVLIKFLFKSSKKWKPLFIYVFTYFLIGDGIFVNFKIFFMIFLMIGLINDRKNEIFNLKLMNI